jgi:hypothetical protein
VIIEPASPLAVLRSPPLIDANGALMLFSRPLSIPP